MPKNNDNQVSKSFADKHPKLNLVLGFIILGIAIILSWLLIQFLFSVICEFFAWIGSFASNVDAVIVVALISGTVSIVAVIISTVAGKILERHFEKQKFLTEKREKPYCEFVSMVYKVMDNAKDEKKYPSEQMIKDMRSFSEQITLWGSPDVADKWINFRMTGMTKTDPKDMLYKLEEIMNCMRKDLGVKKLKKGKLLSFFINDINKEK